MYQPRTYRHSIKDTDLVSFEVIVKETDLYIRARRNLKRKALKSILKHREAIEGYIARFPEFLTTLEPFAVEDDAPLIVRDMAAAGTAASVGPMAAVAGAVAEHVGKELLEYSPEVIIENGGDIFMKITRKRLVGLHAGQSPLTGKIGLEITPEETPLGVCTSSGTVGHSLSFGRADAVVILAPSAALADAVATAVGNVVRKDSDIPRGIELSQSIDGVIGALIVKGDQMGAWGQLKLVSL